MEQRQGAGGVGSEGGGEVQGAEAGCWRDGE